MDNSQNNEISPKCNTDTSPSTNMTFGDVNAEMNKYKSGNSRWYKASDKQTSQSMRPKQMDRNISNSWPLQFSLKSHPNDNNELFVSLTTPSWNTWSQNCGFSSFRPLTSKGLQIYIGSNTIGSQFIISQIIISYTYIPTSNPSSYPTSIPTVYPTLVPTQNTLSPTVNTLSPTNMPSTPSPIIIIDDITTQSMSMYKTINYSKN